MIVVVIFLLGTLNEDIIGKHFISTKIGLWFGISLVGFSSFWNTLGIAQFNVKRETIQRTYNFKD